MRILIRVALWPVKAALTLLEWAMLFMTHFVGIGFYLMAGGCFVLAIAGWLMELMPIAETVRTLGIAFTLFVVPQVGKQMVRAIRKLGHITN